MWIWRVKGIIFTESADHFKFDFYPSTWHIPCEYLHPWGVLSPVALKNVQNGCICGKFEGWNMLLRRYSLRMFDSEVCFYYRNHPSVVRLAGQPNKMTAHPFAFNIKLCLSYSWCDLEEMNQAPEISFDSRQILFNAMIISIVQNYLSKNSYTHQMKIDQTKVNAMHSLHVRRCMYSALIFSDPI